MEKARRPEGAMRRTTVLVALSLLSAAGCTRTLEGFSKDASDIFGGEEKTETGAKSEPAAVPKPKAATPNVYEVQKLLDEQGYDPGAVDGSFGDRTARAIRSYQQNNGMTVTGKVSPELLDRLRKSARTGGAGAAGER